jgi:hypothetical protein
LKQSKLLLGKWEKIGGIDAYVATPTVDYPKDQVILYLTDVFGAPLINAQVSFSFKDVKLRQ